ncbi:MAG: ROK family transcriptional regulator [Spirochaetes bacterium]|jgi:predicted NBD/HSP70 family sugar kinase|nr:ROK family transcriptional regulator [Spirochaetota bacterium]
MADIAKLNIINSSRIIRQIWQFPGISRIEIAEQLKLDRSTITKIMKNLDEKGWVNSIKKTSREVVGRKPVGLTVNTDIGLVLGIEVKTESCCAVLTDINGSIVYSDTFFFEPDKESISDIIHKICTSLRETATEMNKRILMVGVGIPGIVDPFSGTVIMSNPMKINTPEKLASSLQKRLGIPVLIENDANCCCWAELIHRKESDENNFLSIMGEFRSTDLYGLREPGIAVGVGMVINGEVYYGENFTAGEFRSVDWKPGLITQFSVTNKLTSNIKEKPEALKMVFTELAKNIALIINICNFNKIVIAGDFVDYKEEVQSSLSKAVAANWVYSNLEEKKIIVNFSPFGQNAIAFGAACHTLARIFSIPQLGKETLLRGTILLDHLTNGNTEL